MTCANPACGHLKEEHDATRPGERALCFGRHPHSTFGTTWCVCPGFEWPHEPLLAQIDAVIRTRT